VEAGDRYRPRVEEGENVSTAITGIRTVGVPVTDQDRAVEFYVGVLGLEKRLDVPAEQLGGRWIEVAPPGSATTIALVPARRGRRPGRYGDPSHDGGCRVAARGSAGTQR
jgi:catechol 2,3-dioxygenase-like lactoylglutathione lyase family enzyme